MKKRILALFVAASMTVSVLAGCGNSNDTAAEQTTSVMNVKQGAYADKKVGVCIANFEESFSKPFRNELFTYLIQLGFAEENIIVMNSASDINIQKNQVHNFVVDQYDVIFVDPVDAAASTQISDLVAPSGIPLIYVNHEPTKAEEQRWVNCQWNVTYVGNEKEQAGRMQGKFITNMGLGAVDFNKNDKVDYFMVMGDQTDPVMSARTEKSIKFIEKAGIKTKCQAKIETNGDQTLAQQLVTEALAKEDAKVDVIFCNNDELAIGALKAIEVSNRTVGKDILLIGADGSREGLAAVAEGNMTGTVYNDYVTQAHEAGNAAVRYLSGEANENRIGTQFVMVTADNVQAVIDGLTQ